LFLKFNSSSKFIQLFNGFLLFVYFSLHLLNLENLIANNFDLVDNFNFIIIYIFFVILAFLIESSNFIILLFILSFEHIIFFS